MVYRLHLIYFFPVSLRGQCLDLCYSSYTSMALLTFTLSDGTLVLFADDLVIYRPIHSAADLSILERDLAIVASWIASNHLTLNENKWKYMILSCRWSPVEHHPLMLNGCALEKVDAFKYLGVLLSSDLRWSPHIQSISAKARRLERLLYHRFYYDSTQLLYVSCTYPFKTTLRIRQSSTVWDLIHPKTSSPLSLLASKVCCKLWDME